MSDTKEKILQTALYLFALEGFEAVSISKIADEIDISKGALYKHFQNKRDIFNSLIERMNNYGDLNNLNIELPNKEESEELERYNQKVYEVLKRHAVSFFNFWTEDPFARDFRRMITLEQFRNPEMNDLYQKFLVVGPVKKIEGIFESLHKMNPKKLAYKFYSQIHLLISVSDSAESLVNSEELLLDHLDEFGERYFFIRKVEPEKKNEKPKGLLQLAQEIAK